MYTVYTKSGVRWCFCTLAGLYKPISLPSAYLHITNLKCFYSTGQTVISQSVCIWIELYYTGTAVACPDNNFTWDKIGKRYSYISQVNPTVSRTHLLSKKNTESGVFLEKKWFYYMSELVEVTHKTMCWLILFDTNNMSSTIWNMISVWSWYCHNTHTGNLEKNSAACKKIVYQNTLA